MTHPVQQRITPPLRDLGDGFSVRRAIPSVGCRNVGPFVFLDAFGPVTLPPGKGLDVRPHPHIGLATVTYLFAGEILHRDSLGSVQTIRPGEVNWMTSGRGVVHSERTPEGARAAGALIAGIQLWVALPLAHEETEPDFSHYDGVPGVAADGVAFRVILGSARGLVSPVRTHSPMLYVEASIASGARLALPAEHDERAVYVFEGGVDIGGERIGAGELAVLAKGAAAQAVATANARVLLVAGPPLDGPRHVWWNFVSSRRERIREAAAEWKAGRYPRVPGESEFIPLPEDAPPGVADYP